MYCLIFLLLLNQLSAMQPKFNATEVILSKDYPGNKVYSSVFIDEKNIAIAGKESFFILNVATQTRKDIECYKPNREFFNLCINQDRTLLGYNTAIAPSIYNIKTKKMTSPLTHDSWSSKAVLGFTNTNHFIAYENNMYIRFNERGFSENIAMHPTSSIISHFKDNIFILCDLKKLFYDINVASGDFTIIKTRCSCKQVAYSPCNNFIAIKNKNDSVFIAHKNAVRKNILQTKKIGSKKIHYYCMRFYPKNNIVALLNKRGIIEYFDYTNSDKIIAKQQIPSEKPNNFNPPFQSLIFSPQGSKLCVIIHGRCFLLDAPLDIQYPNGWLIYFCIKNKIPKEIFLMIMDYMRS